MRRRIQLGRRKKKKKYSGWPRNYHFFCIIPFHRFSCFYHGMVRAVHDTALSDRYLHYAYAWYQWPRLHDQSIILIYWKCRLILIITISYRKRIDFFLIGQINQLFEIKQSTKNTTSHLEVSFCNEQRHTTL